MSGHCVVHRSVSSALYLVKIFLRGAGGRGGSSKTLKAFSRHSSGFGVQVGSVIGSPVELLV